LEVDQDRIESSLEIITRREFSIEIAILKRGSLYHENSGSLSPLEITSDFSLENFSRSKRRFLFRNADLFSLETNRGFLVSTRGYPNSEVAVVVVVNLSLSFEILLARFAITSRCLPPVFKQQRCIITLDFSGNPHREIVPLWKLSRNQSRRISRNPPFHPLNSKVVPLRGHPTSLIDITSEFTACCERHGASSNCHDATP